MPSAGSRATASQRIANAFAGSNGAKRNIEKKRALAITPRTTPAPSRLREIAPRHGKFTTQSRAHTVSLREPNAAVGKENVMSSPLGRGRDAPLAERARGLRAHLRPPRAHAAALPGPPGGRQSNLDPLGPR